MENLERQVEAEDEPFKAQYMKNVLPNLDRLQFPQENAKAIVITMPNTEDHFD